KYKYILIDEIQDINFYQYQLIKLLSQKSILFIVGDLNQSIYSFRGSKNIYIDLLIQNFNMPTFYLKTNYRSSNKIIKLANNLINYNYEAKNKDKYKIKSFKKMIVIIKFFIIILLIVI
ncbi:MAG: UvrD-helicase domain-containing protein, partial [Candidatus Phytoplasma sp. TWB_XP]